MSGDAHPKAPLRADFSAARRRPRQEEPAPTYVELAVTTNFTFLKGASSPQDMVLTAALLGMPAIGISDTNTLAGVVRAWSAWDEIDWSQQPEDIPRPKRPRVLVGARLSFMDGTPDILAYPQDRAAYGRLCRLLTLGKRGTDARPVKKGACCLTMADLMACQEGMLLALMPPPVPDEATARVLAQLAQACPGRVWLAAAMLHRGEDRRRLRRLKDTAREAGVPLLAVNDVLYHSPERRMLQDVVTCIREKTTIMAAGRKLQANAERHLKPAAEMARLFRDAPEAIAETLRFAERISFDLGELKYEYPDEPVPEGKTPQKHLEDLAWEGARHFYPVRVPSSVKRALHHELRLIRQLDYARYFLTVHDIVRFARTQNPPILCQGRGSAANSAVCYVLGITAVDPTKTRLLFARFLSKERREPPDIDVDFEHERREEVIQYIFGRYGLHRAALVATIIHYKPRSAIREVGKALGLTDDVTAALAGTVWGSWGKGLSDSQVAEAGLDSTNPMIRTAVDLAVELIGFPRHLSQHVGGFVLTRGRLDEIVPIGNAAMEKRTFIEWDKDDIDALGLMKVDVLALGMLTCVRKAFDLIKEHEGTTYELATVPKDIPAVYDMLCKGDSLGVFQVESRAQMNMLPRLLPRVFYDLVIEVAIVRPGPIQGDMVHPYLRMRTERRRAAAEKREFKITFPEPAPPHPPDELHHILDRTLGVPLFQEQAMQLAIDAAGFSANEANGLRRAMATFRNVGTMPKFRDKMIGGMVARGYDPGFAQRCFKQIEGFGSYGFPESHAASFAILVYISSWLKCVHPAHFACALLNSQPMGFYAPGEIVRDAREHGVKIRPVDVAFSEWHNTLERDREGDPVALRLGLRQVDGAREAWLEAIRATRQRGPLTLEALSRHGLERRALVTLADADAFRSLGLDRREALWAVRRLPDDEPLPLFAAADERPAEDAEPLPAMPLSEQVAADYQTLRLSLKGHPMQFLRPLFRAERAMTCAEVAASSDRARMSCAGVILVRQSPGSAKGVVFMTIADETGIANVVVWPKVMARFRREVMAARLVVVEGSIQKSPEGIVHLVARRIVDRTHEMRRLTEDAYQPIRPPRARSDEVLHPQPERHAPRDLARHPRNLRVLPRSRDFH